MVSHAPMFVDLDPSGNGMTALDGRRALAGLIGTVARPVGSIPAATLSSSNMQVTVGQNVWQVGDVSDPAATFLGALDAFTVTPAAGPGTGSRVDSIVLKPDNPKNSGDTDPYLTPSLMAGTTVAPTVAAPYYEIARITVPAGASTASACSIQWMYPAALAALPIIASAFSALGLITPTAPRLCAYVGTDEYLWNGTAWKLWSRPSTAYTPTFGAAFGGTQPTINVATHQVAGGRLFVDILATTVAGTTLVGGTDGTVTLPSGLAIVAGAFNGGGTLFQTSNTSNATVADLVAFVPPSAATNLFRVRARYAPAAAALVRQYQLASAYSTQTGDQYQISASGPLA